MRASRKERERRVRLVGGKCIVWGGILEMCVCACVICEWPMSYYLSSFIHLADRRLPHMGFFYYTFVFPYKESKTQNTMYHNKLLSQNGICRRFKQTGLAKCFFFDGGNLAFLSVKFLLAMQSQFSPLWCSKVNILQCWSHIISTDRVLICRNNQDWQKCVYCPVTSPLL